MIKIDHKSTVTRWPSQQECWDHLRLDKKQTAQLKHIIEENYKKFVNSGLTFRHGEFKEGVSKGWLPRTITFLKNGEVIIKLKDVPLIGKGGQHKVKKVFGAISGKMLARKRVEKTNNDQFILEHFKKHPQQGIVKIIDLHSKQSKKGFIKHYVVEQKYDSDLGHVKDVISIPTIIKVASRLLNGLAALHQLPIGKNGKHNTLFHGDISVVNTLALTNEKKELKLDIDDFGQSGKLGVPDGKDWYFSPEIAKLKKALNDGKNFSAEELKKFNLAYGQPSDVWAMGLVLAHLLRGKSASSVGDVVSIKCINHIVSPPAGILNLTKLTQNQIDTEISHYKNSLPHDSNGKAQKKLWKLINTMLQINPKNRPSAASAYKFAQTIVDKYK